MRRNIYVRDEDTEVFEQAEQMAGSEGSLSSVLAAALREYVATRKAVELGAEVYEVQPGRWPFHGGPHLDRPIKFRGTLLAEGGWGRPDRDNKYEHSAIHRTQGGKIVVVTQRGEETETIGDEDSEWACSVRVAVYDDLEDVPRFDEHNNYCGGDQNGSVWVPEDVWEAAKASVGEGTPQWIG